jgi:hypothetical protein
MSKKPHGRAQRLVPDTPPLQAASVSAGPSALQIANDEIERLTSEVERLKSEPLNAPDLKVESALYAALCHERAMNKILREKIEHNEARWHRFRTNRLLHKTGAKLKPKAAQ